MVPKHLTGAVNLEQTTKTEVLFAAVVDRRVVRQCSTRNRVLDLILPLQMSHCIPWHAFGPQGTSAPLALPALSCHTQLKLDVVEPHA